MVVVVVVEARGLKNASKGLVVRGTKTLLQLLLPLAQRHNNGSALCRQQHIHGVLICIPTVLFTMINTAAA